VDPAAFTATPTLGSNAPKANVEVVVENLHVPTTLAVTVRVFVPAAMVDADIKIADRAMPIETIFVQAFLLTIIYISIGEKNGFGSLRAAFHQPMDFADMN